MWYALIIEIVVLLFLVHLFRKSREFFNPYKLFMVFGGKGSGKTTLMNKLGIKHKKAGWKVYSDRKIPGCYHFDINQFGLCRFPDDSVILIDEVSLIWGNRDFKNFQKNVETYFRYQRQYKNKIYLFSQSFDVDKKIRLLTDYMYLTVCYFNIFSVARRIRIVPSVTAASKNAAGESRIVEDYEFDPWYKLLFGGMICTYIPAWSKYFKSFDPPFLDDMPAEELPDIEAPVGKRKTLVAACCAARDLFMESGIRITRVTNPVDEDEDHLPMIDSEYIEEDYKEKG